MKKILALALTLVVPAVLFLNAWQGYRYFSLSHEVSTLESRQQDLVEKNMGVIAQIAFEQSPARVQEKALRLGLGEMDHGRATRVVVGAGTEQLP